MTGHNCLSADSFAILAALSARKFYGIRELSQAVVSRKAGTPVDLAILRLHCEALRDLLADKLVMATRTGFTVQFKLTRAGRRAASATAMNGLLQVGVLATATVAGLIIGCAQHSIAILDKRELGFSGLTTVNQASVGEGRVSRDMHCVVDGCRSIKTSLGYGYYDDAVLARLQRPASVASISIGLAEAPTALRAESVACAESCRTIGLSVSFGFARSSLGPKARQAIRDVRHQALRSHSVVVRGSTDASGNREGNRRLATTRAESVRSELVRLGVAPDRVRVEGCTDCFVASNLTQAGRVANRRADISFAAMEEVSPV